MTIDNIEKLIDEYNKEMSETFPVPEHINSKIMTQQKFWHYHLVKLLDSKRKLLLF